MSYNLGGCLGGCLGGVLGLVVVLGLAAAGFLNNDAWLFIGPVGGAFIGQVFALVVGLIRRRRREARMVSDTQWQEGSQLRGESGSVAIKKVPMTREEGSDLRGIERRVFVFAAALAVMGGGAIAIGQSAWGIPLGSLALFAAASGAWTWLNARDRTTVWAVGTIGLSSTLDLSSRYSTRVCSVWIGEQSLDIECDVYDRLESLAKQTGVNEQGQLCFVGAVQFVPGSDLVLRVQAPVGTGLYAHPGLAPSSAPSV